MVFGAVGFEAVAPALPEVVFLIFMLFTQNCARGQLWVAVIEGVKVQIVTFYDYFLVVLLPPASLTHDY